MTWWWLAHDLVACMYMVVRVPGWLGWFILIRDDSSSRTRDDCAGLFSGRSIWDLTKIWNFQNIEKTISVFQFFTYQKPVLWQHSIVETYTSGHDASICAIKCMDWLGKVMSFWWNTVKIKISILMFTHHILHQIQQILNHRIPRFSAHLFCSEFVFQTKKNEF